ncbi:MAG: hypothetical protein K2H85_06865 [Allobaculum sp.]|nr:hypothetical protein [Allobaculum sp.]
MVLSSEEMGILENLVGRKAEKILVPVPKDSATKPVETVLVLNKNKGVLIDSCYRPQHAIETPHGYPQMRVRVINRIPEYPNGEVIEFSNTGEIVRAIEVTTEQIVSPKDRVHYAKSVHLKLTGKREVTITRETYRSPVLSIYEDCSSTPLEYEPNAKIIHTVHTF